MSGGHGSSDKAEIDEAYYMLVRKLGYTWDEVLDEYVAQTMYSFRQLEDESKERQKRKREMEKEQKRAKRKAK